MNEYKEQNKKRPIVLLDPAKCSVKAGSRRIKRSRLYAMRRILETIK